MCQGPGRWGFDVRQRTSRTSDQSRLIENSLRHENRKGEDNLQPLECRCNIWEFEEYSPVWDPLVVEHQADTPDGGGEANVLGTGQVVQNNLGLGLGGHIVWR